MKGRSWSKSELARLHEEQPQSSTNMCERTLALPGLFSLLFVAPAPGAEKQDASWVYDFTSRSRTPSLSWARPGDYRRVEALVVQVVKTSAHYNGPNPARDWAELEERMDLEASVALLFPEHPYWPSNKDVGVHTRGVSLGESIQRLVSFLEKSPPVIVLCHGALSFLEKTGRLDLIEDVLTRVREGRTNLILTSSEKEGETAQKLWALPAVAGAGELLTRALPVPSTRELSCSVAPLGQGRIFRISHGEWLDFQPHFEFAAMPFYARVFIAASGQSLEPIIRATAPLELSGGEGFMGPRIIEKLGLKLDPGIGSIAVTVIPDRAFQLGFADPYAEAVRGPQAQAGNYWVALQVLSPEGKIKDWAATTLAITTPARVVVAVDGEVHLPGSLLMGTVTVTGAQPDARVTLRLKDNHERTRSVAIGKGNGASPFQLQLPVDSSRLMRVDAELSAPGVLAWAEFPVRRPTLLEDYPSACWSEHPSRLGPRAQIPAPAFPLYYLWQNFRRISAADWGSIAYFNHRKDSSLSIDSVARWAARADWTPAFYATHIWNHSIELLGMIRERDGDWLAKLGKEGRKWGAIYSLGDEIDMDRNPGLIPIPYFQNWVRQSYGTLEKLNQSWGREYRNWTQVTAIEESQAREENRGAQWVDQETCMDDVWVETIGYLCGRVREFDPEAIIGYEGSSLLDIAKTLRVITLTVPYDNRTLSRLVPSLARPGAMVGHWWGGGYGYCHQPHLLGRLAWQWLLEGKNSPWWFTDNPGSLLGHDLSESPTLSIGLRSLAELHRGLARVISGESRRQEKIAIYYSRPSELLSIFRKDLQDQVSRGEPFYSEGLGPGGRNQARHVSVDSAVGFEHILEDLGLSYRYVSYLDVRDKGLSASDCEVLVLPYTACLSDVEAQAISKFTREGGMLMADVRPGTRDEHGRLRTVGALDSLLGVNHDMNTERTVEETLRVAAIDETGMKVHSDAAITLAGGKPRARIGNLPGCIEHKAGSGKAILLNFFAGSYSRQRHQGKDGGQEIRAILRRLLFDDKLQSDFKLTDATGNWPGHVRSFRFDLKEGHGRLLGILQTEGRQTLTVDFGAKGFVHECREGRLLGEEGRATLDLAEDTPRILAWLPFKISRLSLRTPEPATQGDTVTIEMDASFTGEPGPLFWHYELLAPDGKPCAWVRNSAARTPPQIRFAHDDPPGTYTLRVREVLTGAMCSAQVILRKRP